MIRFEVRLAAFLATLSCEGEDAEPTCFEPGDQHHLDLGWLEVPLGEPCPAPADVESLLPMGLNFHPLYEGPTCAIVERVEDQVVETALGLGRFYEPPATGEAPNADVCVYEAIYSSTVSIIPGRPLVLDGAPVVARCEAAGEGWLRAALLEHASVASFARFTLELMRWGAPLDLLRQAQQAGLEEVEHARLCFRLASRALGREVAPGTLPLGEQVPLAPTFAAFVDDVVREGCVGEALAAVDAAERSRRTVDQEERAVLDLIVADESRHASLAWATLAWALRQQPDLRPRVAAVFAEARLGSTLPRAWDEVLAPSWGALARLSLRDPLGRERWD